MINEDAIKAARDRALHELMCAEVNDDTECAHGDADQALCDLLETLGFADVVEQYHKIRKWYA